MNILCRILIGKYEEADYLKKNNVHCETQVCTDNEDSGECLIEKGNVNRKAEGKNVNIFMKSLEAYRQIIERLKHRSKHICCPHPFSCVHYVLKVYR